MKQDRNPSPAVQSNTLTIHLLGAIQVAAVAHAVAVHGPTKSPELREQIRASLQDEARQTAGSKK